MLVSNASPLVPLPASHAPVECPVCLEVVDPGLALRLMACGHVCCIPCLEEYFLSELNSSRVIITCPQPNCGAPCMPSDVESLLHHRHLVNKYRDRLLRYALMQNADSRWCPEPDCDFCVLAPPSCRRCPKLTCLKCNKHFCYLCNQTWHSGKCDVLKGSNVKTCPKCRAPVEKKKDGGCNLMTCAMCKTQFCWLCGKETGDLHFVTPTGCTYWGSGRQTRAQFTRQLILQMLGLPIVLAISIVLLIPFMILVHPILRGRMAYRQYFWKKRIVRIAITLGATILAFILSVPITAIIIVFGTLIYVVYTYVVLPAYLCCGKRPEPTDDDIPFLELPDEENRGNLQMEEEEEGKEIHLISNLDIVSQSPVKQHEGKKSKSTSIDPVAANVHLKARNGLSSTSSSDSGDFTIINEENITGKNKVKTSAAQNRDDISLTLSIEENSQSWCCNCCRRIQTRKIARQKNSTCVQTDGTKCTCCGRTIYTKKTKKSFQ